MATRNSTSRKQARKPICRTFRDTLFSTAGPELMSRASQIGDQYEVVVGDADVDRLQPIPTGRGGHKQRRDLLMIMAIVPGLFDPVNKKSGGKRLSLRSGRRKNSNRQHRIDRPASAGIDDVPVPLSPVPEVLHH